MEKLLFGTETYKFYAVSEELANAEFKIYRATNKNTGKFYIGCTKQLMIRRLEGHKAYAFSPSRQEDGAYLQNSIRKHGWEAFEWEVIEKCETEEEMYNREEELIEETQALILGYNNSKGQKGFAGRTDEQLQALIERLSSPCVSLNLWTNEVQEWRSQTEAAKEIDVYPGTISYNISQPERFKTVARQYIFANTVEELYQRRKVLEEENLRSLPFVYIEKDTLKVLEASPEDEKIGSILNPGFTTLNSVQGLYTVLRHNVDQVLKEIKQYIIYTCVVDLNTFEARAFKENREAAEFVGCSPDYMSSRTAKGRFSIDPCETQLFFKASQYDVETGMVLDIPFFNAVEKYDLEGNLIDTFVGIEKAWKATPEIVAKRSITRVVKGQRNQIRNYIFKSRPATIREFREMKKSFEF